MTIKSPVSEVPLRQLWKEAFGDSDAFLDSFFGAAFSPERSRCAEEDGKLLGALYWFDVQVRQQKYAYLYAIATAKDSRGKGVCRALMAATHSELKAQGYSGCILVPQSQTLFRFYGAMGYQQCAGVEEIVCTAAAEAVPLKEITAAEYAALRRKLLPPGGVVQEQENLEFLQTQCKLYAGEKCLLAATQKDGLLTAMEYLGETALCGGILRTLNCARGTFRMPGAQMPFAMYLPFFESSIKPEYFGLAFD